MNSELLSSKHRSSLGGPRYRAFRSIFDILADVDQRSTNTGRAIFLSVRAESQPSKTSTSLDPYLHLRFEPDRTLHVWSVAPPDMICPQHANQNYNHHPFDY